MKQILLRATLGLALALGSAQAQAQTATSVPPPTSPLAAFAVPLGRVASASAPASASQAVPAQRAAPRKDRTRGKRAQVQRLKICHVQATAEKGEGRTAALSSCIKQ